jgi:hypothetical protein
LCPTGSRTHTKNPLFFDIFEKGGGAESGTLPGISVVADLLSDPDLQFLFASWAKLPKSIPAGILAFVKGSVDELGDIPVVWS